MDGKQRYLFIDVETTGLDPEKNEVIEVGAIVCEQADNDDKPTELCRYTCKLRAEHGVVDIEALAVNGRRLCVDVLTDEISAEYAKEIVYGFADFLADYVTNDTLIIGNNVKFDIEFVDALFVKYGISSKRILSQRKSVDIQQIAKFLHDAGALDLKRFNTAYLAKEILDQEVFDHTALGDTITQMKLYFKMRELV